MNNLSRNSKIIWNLNMTLYFNISITLHKRYSKVQLNISWATSLFAILSYRHWIVYLGSYISLTAKSICGLPATCSGFNEMHSQVSFLLQFDIIACLCLLLIPFCLTLYTCRMIYFRGKEYVSKRSKPVCQKLIHWEIYSPHYWVFVF